MASSASLGELEHAIMDVLWSDGSSSGLTVREVLDRLTGRDLAYTTVMTVLSRLETKGVTTRTRDGRAWRYRAAESRETMTARAMASPLDALDPQERQTAILHFLSDASPEDLAAVREAMAAVESRGEAGTGRGRARGRGSHRA